MKKEYAVVPSELYKDRLKESLAELIAAHVTDEEEVDQIIAGTRAILKSQFGLELPCQVTDAEVEDNSQPCKLEIIANLKRQMSPAMCRVAACLLSVKTGSIVPLAEIFRASTSNPSMKNKRLVYVYVCKIRQLLVKAGCHSDAIACVSKRGYIVKPGCENVLANLADWTPPKTLRTNV